MRTALTILTVLPLFTGCTSTYVTYDTPNGSHLSVHRRSCIAKVELPSVKFLPDGSVELIGYQNDGGSTVVKDAVGAAVKEGVKAATGK